MPSRIAAINTAATPTAIQSSLTGLAIAGDDVGDDVSVMVGFVLGILALSHIDTNSNRPVGVLSGVQHEADHQDEPTNTVGDGNTSCDAEGSVVGLRACAPSAAAVPKSQATIGSITFFFTPMMVRWHL